MCRFHNYDEDKKYNDERQLSRTVGRQKNKSRDDKKSYHCSIKAFSFFFWSSRKHDNWNWKSKKAIIKLEMKNLKNIFLIIFLYIEEMALRNSKTIKDIIIIIMNIIQKKHKRKYFFHLWLGECCGARKRRTIKQRCDTIRIASSALTIMFRKFPKKSIA